MGGTMWMEKSIKDILDMLIGQRVSAIWRTSWILRLGIGDIAEDADKEVTAMKTSAFTLEVQSAWRIVNEKKGKILLASSDVFSPRSNAENEEGFDWNLFQWDILGNNLFDEKSKLWFEETPRHITGYKRNIWGDLWIYFSDGDCLEIFIDTSEDIKCWILSEFQKKEKLEYTGIGWGVFEEEDEQEM